MEARLAEEEDNKIQSVGDQILMMKKKIINGTVTLMKKKFLDSNEIIASVQDRFDELIGRKVSFQLISSSSSELINGDPHHPSGYKGKIGKASFLEDWASKITPLTANDISFPITFDWNEEDMGLPGAFIIQNFHSNEFYLKTLTLKDIPGHDHPIHFICNSWIYPSKCYENDRVFFTNQTYLPSQTPSPLLYYREKELEVVRGKGSGILQEWDRVYDYDIYNDLGDPDKGDKYNRPILGGSSSYPYPRRCRTGRPPANKDPRYESRLSIFKSLDIYIPRDERLSHLKMCDVVAFGFKTIFQFVVPGFEALLDTTPTEFDKFEDILDVYQKGIKIPDKISSLVRMIKEEIPFQTFKELLRTDGERFCHFPVPQIIENDKSAWSTDEEFAREMLAGLNPVVITCLQEFPANSMLLKNKEQIVKDLEGLSIDEALEKKKLFKLDFHDAFMPYLNRINSSTSTKIYATRTLLFLKNDGTLKPLAIELSLPNPNIENEEISQVYMPAENGIEGTIWQLAKAYVAANDAGYHQLICHWLHTHAVMEPIIIATNRQLSVVHPIHKLLHPHFRDTMNLNALARQGLINGGGLLERTMFPSQFCMEISSLMYNDWTFPHQALPADLLKRGVAVEDENSKHGLRLLIEDYPYAVDGLEIWSAIKTWVKDYCSFYYKTDDMIQEDSELQSWWNEVREKGHPDKKDEPWWPKMEKQEDLIETCTIIIWVASALHAAVNFGQYPYGGYLPNRPAMTRRLLPEPGTDDYEEMGSKPEKAFLKTVTSQLLSIVGISLVEILSRHSVDEVFLGQRENMNDWTRDEEVLKAFEEFGKKLLEVEEKIMGMNKDGKWRNRVGPGNVAYTLLLPSSEVGLTGRGIPNSVSM
ncbi:probable linoleate 9S-lipoxygenase 5 [Impatiens glandulifera]|uniref:probable linoleate 9S-lipoxygenase 5 n=1 Tax=Impatiens glandulifera TaxID=253017 RepID=UPI001FB0D480|nr:probable linoleate 9S-lipoxygenase 5 [Impatiens glandulifera]